MENFTTDEFKLCNEINKAYYNALLHYKFLNYKTEPITLLVYNKDVVNMIEGTGQHLDLSPYISCGLSEKTYKWFVNSHSISSFSDNHMSKYYTMNHDTNNSTTFKTYLAIKEVNSGRYRYLPDDQFNRVLSWFTPLSDNQIYSLAHNITK